MQFLEALDIVKKYRAQIEAESAEPLVIPKKGDWIELIDFPTEKHTLKKGQKYQVAKVWKLTDRKGNEYHRIFLYAGSTTYRPEINSTNSRFVVVTT